MARSEPPCPRKGLRPRLARYDTPVVIPLSNLTGGHRLWKGLIMSDRSYAASPFRLNLEQQRKRAKELLKGWQQRDAKAALRLARHHPRASGAESVRLADAQLVIARELGVPSWPRLKAHIEASDHSLARLTRLPTAPDGDKSTLHLRCGSDIELTLRDAGFTGTFQKYTDPFCGGPVTQDADWLERRADHVAASVGQYAGMTRDDVRRQLHDAEEALATAPRYERVVLWFEHDIFDQLILARILSVLSARPPRRLELVSVGQYPGAARYIGLGQLPPEALHLLWDRRVPVTSSMLDAGCDAWAALTAPEPCLLGDIAHNGTSAIPEMGRAMRRFAQEYPWETDGLALSQRLVLQLIADGAATGRHVYRSLTTQLEPLPWLSDLMFRDLLDGMQRTQIAAFRVTSNPDERDWRLDQLEITPEGQAVLDGTLDWWSLGPSERWLGGVRIAGDAPRWVWDDGRALLRRAFPETVGDATARGMPRGAQPSHRHDAPPSTLPRKRTP